MQSVIKNITQRLKKVISFFKTLEIVFKWKTIVLTVLVIFFFKNDFEWLFFGKELKISTAQQYVLDVCINILNVSGFWTKTALAASIYFLAIFFLFNSFFTFYINKFFSKFNYRSTFYNNKISKQKSNKIGLVKKFWKYIN